MLIADLHIHSKYSRATSRDCVPEYLDFWARRKGIHLVGTGDFTHPAWRAELSEKLVPAEEGLYTLGPGHRFQEDTAPGPEPRFVVSGEISTIYKKDGRTRKVHSVILLPSLEAADLLSRKGGPSWGWTPGTCWRSPWSPVRRPSSSRPTSGPPISRCSGPFPALTAWRPALAT